MNRIDLSPATLASAGVAQPSEATAPDAAASKKAHDEADVAHKFEAIFLRQMLSSLEKTNKLGGEKASGGSGGIYGSMMVNSLADSISQSGGIGLADVILRAMHGSHSDSGGGKK